MLEPDLRPPMHSIEEQFEIRSIETAMENGTSRYVMVYSCLSLASYHNRLPLNQMLIISHVSFQPRVLVGQSSS